MARNLSRRLRRTVSRSRPFNSASAWRHRLAGRPDGGGRVAVRAADRLGDDAVDDAEPREIGRGDLHVGGGVLRLGGVAPQDRGGALRRDDAVDRVLQHQHAVGGGDGDRAARAAFAEDHRDVRHAEIEAGFGRARDGFGLAALLRVDAGIGAGGVDQRQHRNVEPVGHLHQPHGLAVALRPRHAEIMLEAGFGGRALLVADDADALALEPAEAADDGLVLGELAVAGERDELGDQRADVVEAMRPLRMARDLRLLPGRQLGVEIAKLLRGFGLEPGDLVGDVGRVVAGLHRAQFLGLGLKFGHRLFEIEITAHLRKMLPLEFRNPPETGLDGVQVKQTSGQIPHDLPRPIG